MINKLVYIFSFLLNYFLKINSQDDDKHVKVNIQVPCIYYCLDKNVTNVMEYYKQFFVYCLLWWCLIF